jgi:NAD+ synthase
MEKCMGNLTDRITAWIREYAESADMDSLVVGVSGGIDSAVVSTLCARTGLPTFALSMPIRQKPEQHDLSVDHCLSLLTRYANVHFDTVDLTSVFEQFADLMCNYDSALAFANSRSRLRMITLYQVAQARHGLVVGTGNRVEDFGVGFYTKYGDGGVDISPIADLTKTEVWALGRELGVDQRIIDAAPTDGLWDDGRVDQDQLGGLSYSELELAMQLDSSAQPTFEAHEQRLLDSYRAIRKPNLHKMQPIPVFKK